MQTGHLVAFPPGSRQDSAMLTWLRIVVSCFCLVLCVLLVALWVRSCFYVDLIDQGPKYRRASLRNRRHVIELFVFDPPMYDPRDRQDRWFRGRLGGNVPSQSWFYWRYKNDPRGRSYIVARVPHWLLVLATALVAYGAKPKPRWKFGMRELFVLSTIGAITVGTLAVVLRAIRS